MNTIQEMVEQIVRSVDGVDLNTSKTPQELLTILASCLMVDDKGYVRLRVKEVNL